MNKEHLFDLAFSFREKKLWKQLVEEELFAVKLSANGKNDQIGYCFVMGTNGQHKAVAIYPGVAGDDHIILRKKYVRAYPDGVVDY